jgi:hypothetical protein
MQIMGLRHNIAPPLAALAADSEAQDSTAPRGSKNDIMPFGDPTASDWSAGCENGESENA